MRRSKIIFCFVLATAVALPALAQPPGPRRPPAAEEGRGPGPGAPPGVAGERGERPGPTARGRRGRHGPPEAARGRGADRAPGLERARFAKLRRQLLTQRVGLSEEQVGRVVDVFESERPDHRSARRQLRRARRQLRGLFQSDSDDQEAWAAALERMKDARATLHRLREQEYEKLEQILTPKKRAELLRAMHRVRREMRKRRGGGRRGPGGR